VAVCDEGRLSIEPVRHLAAGTMTGVLLTHLIPPFRGDKPTLARNELPKMFINGEPGTLAWWGRVRLSTAGIAVPQHDRVTLSNLHKGHLPAVDTPPLLLVFECRRDHARFSFMPAWKASVGPGVIEIERG